MSNTDQLRLLVRVARLYYEAGLRQPEIAERLQISQAKVSRLLKRAADEGIVRITIATPVGVHPDLEERLEEAYGLQEAVVVDTHDDDERSLMHDLGAAAAFHLESTLKAGDVIGISSWSATLLAMVNAMRPVRTVSGITVVQILGGVGDPGAEVHATELTRRLAGLVQGTPILLPVPGVVGSLEAREVLERDEYVSRVLDLWATMTVALVGIGAVTPSPLLERSGNVFEVPERRLLTERGAVGDVCLRFFDAAGGPIVSDLDSRVIGLTLDQLRNVPRSIAVAGGVRKLDAIRGALAGGYLRCLVTDRRTAEALLGAARAA